MIDIFAKYTYRVTWSGEGEAFVGLCSEFPKPMGPAFNAAYLIKMHLLSMS